MIKIKMCGLTRIEDICAVNEIKPDYIGFVFVKKSRRYIPPEKAAELRRHLDKDIKAVGVFADEDLNEAVSLLRCSTIDMAQLHGRENDQYILDLKAMTNKPVIKAFRIVSQSDAAEAQSSAADMILLDAGAGDGKTFDWSLAGRVTRPYFLAGGLTAENIAEAIHTLHPYGIDVSSGIETDGSKDKSKMAALMAAVRKEERK